MDQKGEHRQNLEEIDTGIESQEFKGNTDAQQIHLPRGQKHSRRRVYNLSLLRIWTVSLVMAVQTLPAQAQMKCAGQLLATDYNGAVISGSKETLIAAVNNGETIRVGWGIDFDGDRETDLIHWSPANFLSVWKGEVFTQV